MKLRFKRTLSEFWVSSHDKLSDFYASSWQRGISGVPLLLVRLVLSAVTVGTLVLSLTNMPTSYWMIFLTNWGYLLLTATILSGLLVSIVAVIKKLPDEGGSLPWYMRMYWFLFNISIPLAFVITALYWILLYDPNAENEELNFELDIMTHGVNSVVALAEVLIARTPMRLLHIYQPLALGLWYALFTVIYYLADGTDSAGNPYIYPVLNWEDAGNTMLVVVLAFVGLLVIYMVLRLIVIFRDLVSVALVRTVGHDLPPVPCDDVRNMV